MLLSSCSSPIEDGARQLELEQELPDHPLDMIVGDKVLDPITGDIRPNNFKDLIGLPERDVAMATKLYESSKLNDSLYVLTQAKSYTEARAFSLLLKVRDSLVTDYFVLNDHRLSYTSIHIDENGLLLLCDDSWNNNLHWKRQDNILVISLDAHFGERWRYAPKPGTYAIMAHSLRKDRDIVVQAKVITGCTICYNVVELILEENGSCTQVKEVGFHNSSRSVAQEVLNEVFLGSRSITP